VARDGSGDWKMVVSWRLVWIILDYHISTADTGYPLVNVYITMDNHHF
jgi:hypothetical protein